MASCRASSSRSSSSRRIVDCASVGASPKKMSDVTETVKFTIHDFKNRYERKGDVIASPILYAHGYRWSVDVYPRGLKSDKGEYVYCQVEYCDERVPEITHDYKVELKAAIHQSPCSLKYGVRFDRGQVKAHCLEADGSFVIEAHIQVSEEDSYPRVWYPKQLQPQGILVELYDDADSETSDVAFSVDGTVFRAHTSILFLRCKHLYDITKAAAGASDDDETTTETATTTSAIPIDETRIGIFKSVLDFLYTVKIPVMDDEATAKEVLVAADRFRCVPLKLHAESVLVDRFLDFSNAAALLLLADSHFCALLKEAAIGMFLEDPNAVAAAKRDWARVRKSRGLLDELLDAFCFSKRKKDASSSSYLSEADDDDDDYEDDDEDDEDDDEDEGGGGEYDEDVAAVAGMDVASLRQALEDDGLDLDGSRKMLVSRLQKHRSVANAGPREPSGRASVT